MNAEQIRSFCQILGAKIGPSKRKGWVEICCPLAEFRHPKGRDRTPSFGIQLAPGRPSKAHCFSCGFSGTPGDIILELRHRKGRNSGIDFKTAYALAETDENLAGMEMQYAEQEPDDVVKKPVHYFPEKWLGTFPHCEEIEEGLEYCASRATPLSVIKKLDLRYDPLEQRVCFPVRDFDGALVGLHGRMIVSKKKYKPRFPGDEYLKYRMYVHAKQNNPVFWLGEEWVDLDKPVVVTESVFDLSRVFEVYQNVVCPLTADFSAEKAKRLRGASYLITLFDGDLAGRKGTVKLKRNLREVRFSNIALDEGVDPGECSPKLIKELLNPFIQNIYS